MLYLVIVSVHTHFIKEKKLSVWTHHMLFDITVFPEDYTNSSMTEYRVADSFGQASSQYPILGSILPDPRILTGLSLLSIAPE